MVPEQAMKVDIKVSTREQGVQIPEDTLMSQSACCPSDVSMPQHEKAP